MYLYSKNSTGRGLGRRGLKSLKKKKSKQQSQQKGYAHHRGTLYYVGQEDRDLCCELGNTS